MFVFSVSVMGGCEIWIILHFILSFSILFCQQEKSKPSAPPSLLSMDTKPATMGLKLTASGDAGQSDRKLPKALEDVLAMKDIRAKQVSYCVTTCCKSFIGFMQCWTLYSLTLCQRVTGPCSSSRLAIHNS